MDPYDTLGVPRGCTREEVKNAFRARAWHAHPDRGGENESFIRLCTAYQQILEQLDRSPSPVPGKPARAPHNRPSSKPPDPNWDPELVVRDEPPRHARPSKPADPNWNPELIVRDGPPRPARPSAPSDPKVARETYVSWLRRVSAQYARREPLGRSRWFRTIGMIILLCLIIASIAMCWIVWDHAEKMEAEARRAEGRFVK
jgi:hypothetical protein